MEELQADIQTLLPHRVRWEYLELQIPRVLLPIIEGPTALLRELNLTILGSTSPPLSLTNAPLLRTVRMNDIAAANIILPWANLTSLTLCAVYPRECTPILLQTCSLVHCELHLFLDNPTAIQPELELSSLESLTFIDEREDDPEATEYLGTFIAPRLRKLKVPELYIGTDPISQLTQFMAKSGCKVEEFYITGVRSISKELYRKTFPFVSSFSFDDEDNEELDGPA